MSEELKEQLPAASGGSVAVSGGYALPDDYNPEQTGLEDSKTSGGVPYIKLLQPMSPEVTDNGAPMGKFFHTTSEELFDNVIFVPSIVQDYAVLWLDRGEGAGSGFVSRHQMDEEIVRDSYFQATGRRDVPWGSFAHNDPESKAKFVVTKYLFGIQITPDGDNLPMCYSFKSTHIPALEAFKQRAKSLQAFHPKLNRKVVMPLYLVRWKMTALKEKNDKGVFYVPEIKLDGEKKTDAFLRADDPAAKMAQELYKQIASAKDIGQVIKAEEAKTSAAVDDTIPF